MLIDFGDNQMLNAISGSMIKCRDISRISVQRIKDLRERSRDSLLLAVNKLSRLNMRQQSVCFLEPKYNYNFFQCRKSWTKQNLTMMQLSVQQFVPPLGGIWPRWCFCDDSFQDILLLAVTESFL